MKVKIIDKTGKQGSEATVFASFKDKKANVALLHQSLVAFLANKRRAIANTKTRSEVKASGKKPWKQKGTGRARVGTVTSPIWRGGGIVFGPTKNVNWRKEIPSKMKKNAIISAIVAKNNSKTLLVLEEIKFSKISTKGAQEFLNKIPFEGSATIVVESITKEIKKSFSNIPYISVVKYSNVNINDILSNKYLIVTENSAKLLEERLLNKKPITKAEETVNKK